MPTKRQKIYTVGHPFWILFVSWGYTPKVHVGIIWDDSAQCYVATSSGLRGLVCEADTREKIEADIAIAVDILLPLQFVSGFKPPYVTELQFL